MCDVRRALRGDILWSGTEARTLRCELRGGRSAAVRANDERSNVSTMGASKVLTIRRPIRRRPHMVGVPTYPSRPPCYERSASAKAAISPLTQAFFGGLDRAN